MKVREQDGEVGPGWARRLPPFVRNRLTGRYRVQRILRNIGWLSFDSMVRLVMGLLVGVWAARYLGPERLGLLNYAVAFVGLFTPIAVLGSLNGIAVRDIVRMPEDSDEILGTAFGLKLVGSLIAVPVIVIVILILQPGATLANLIVLIVSMRTIFLSADVINVWFESQIQSKYIVWARSAAYLTSTVSRVLLILLQASVVAFAFLLLFEAVLLAVGLFVMYYRSGGVVTKWRVDRARAIRMLNDSWPLILSGFAIIVQAQIDQVMLGQMMGAYEVGQYSVAIRLTTMAAFLPMAVTKSVSSTVAEAKRDNEQAYREKLLGVYRLMFIVFLVTATPLFLFGRPIVLLLYGEAYRMAGVLLSLSAIRLLFTSFGSAKGLFITNESLFRYSMFTAVLGSVVNVMLNYLLIPIYGPVGAIWATIASFTVTIFLVDIFFAKPRQNLKLMLMGMATPFAAVRR